MSNERSASAVTDAWNALWKPDSIYHLPSKLKKKTRVGLAWFRPVKSAPLPDSGPIVVLNREPWGMVTVNLKDAAVKHLWNVEPKSFDFDPATGKIAAKVTFPDLKLAGDYEVRRGRASASAIKLAGSVLQEGPMQDNGNDHMTLARNYQAQLANSGDSGRFMLDSYYANNDAYADAFNNTKLLGAWRNLPTNGQTTAYYSSVTANAAQPANSGTVPVNSDPYYKVHAFTMQLLVAQACSLRGHPEASSASYSFKNVTQGPADVTQTVDNVLTTVQTTPPPAASYTQVHQALLRTSVREDLLAVDPEPEWMAEVRERVKPIIAEMEQEEEDVRRGVILREETGNPIHSGFVSYLAPVTVTLHGHVSDDENGRPKVTFTSVEGNVPPAELKLGAFPGQLHPQLVGAVARANFLKSILASRTRSSLSKSKLLPQFSRVMTLALQQTLGSR